MDDTDFDPLWMLLTVRLRVEDAEFDAVARLLWVLELLKLRVNVCSDEAETLSEEDFVREGDFERLTDVSWVSEPAENVCEAV